MMHKVQVEAARIPDRDRLLKTLTEHGHDARAVDEVGITVHSAAHSESTHEDLSREVYRDVEDVVMALGDAFVPMKHEGVIYLRPPVG